MTAQRYAPLLLFLTAALTAAFVFVLCYNFDNKYTKQSPAFVDGAMLLDDELLAQRPVVHLIDGWAFYRDRLFSPEDFAVGEPPGAEIIYIGQYPGFEGNDGSRSPHGSATYRMDILLPAEMRSYTLELPEIYSAYCLYINGELMEQFGNPDPESYQPITGNSTITFRAKDSVEILLAVTDYSGFYSGLTYPPAFGEARAVLQLLDIRFAIRLIACSIAFFLGLFYITTSLLSEGKNRLGLVYGLMCLFFVGSVCYPITQSLWTAGPAWYGFEGFCHGAMLLCVLLIGGKITKAPIRVMKIGTVVGLVVCIVALFSPIMIVGSLGRMLAFSTLMHLYSWVLAVLLSGFAIFGAYRGSTYSEIVLAGIAVFDCALVMDRLLPGFEPVIFGWFIEIAGAVIVVCFGIVLAREAVIETRDKLVLEGRIDSMTRLIDMQQKYYPMMLEGIQEARAARHDLRHHMRLIRELAAKENLSGLMDYLKEYQADQKLSNPVSHTENYVVDTLLRHFSILAHSANISFEVQVAMPEHIPLMAADLAIVLSNLLENALEACAGLPQKEAYIKCSLRVWNNNLCIIVKNSFDGELIQKNGRLFSRKRNGKEGVGLSSVSTIIQRLCGTAEFTPQGRVFQVSVVLPMSVDIDSPVPV